MKKNGLRRNQLGMSTVEFAIVGSTFFLILFAVVEFGRLMFVLNTLDEVTRRGARLAAVCPIDNASQSFVQDQARFNGNHLNGLTAEMVDLAYLTADGSPADLSDITAAIPSIRYVRASINNYQHQLLVPILNLTVPAPDFSTTIPSESLGVHPDGSSASCS